MTLANPLSPNEERLWGMINFMPDATWIINDKGVVIAWNRACEEFTGIRAQDIVGRGDYEYALPFYGERRPLLIDVALRPDPVQEQSYVSFERTGDTVSAEIFIPRLGDDSVYIWGTARRLYDADGTIIGAIETVRDITERKRFERRERIHSHILGLIARGEPLREILHDIAVFVEQENSGALCAIFLMDKTGGRLVPGAAPSLPHGFELAMGARGVDTGTGSCGSAVFLRERVVVENIDSHPCRDWFQPAREAGLHSCWSEPIRSSSGRLLGVFAVYYCGHRTPGADEIRGVEAAATMAGIAIERNNTDDALRESEERLRLIFEASPSGIIQIGEESRIVYANPRMAEMLGFSLEELIGTLYDDHIRKSEVMAMKQFKQRLLAGEDKYIEVERGYVRRDGSEFRGLLSGRRLVGPHGEFRSLLGVVTDITDRTRMREVMQQTEKMLMVGGLAAGMAHELNNPLGAILQNIQNIQRRLSYELAANEHIAGSIGVPLRLVREYLKQRGIFDQLDYVTRAGSQAADIIAKLQAFSRKGSVVLEKVFLNELIDQALQLAACDYDLKKQHDFRTIEIRRDYDPDLPPVVMNRSEIEQVLFNIIKNAAQALSSHKAAGKPCITVVTRRDSNHACISVEDNGPGVPPEITARIFEPFYTTKDVGSGHGLGLSVAFALVVNNHNGSLNIDSEPGRGTRMIVRLPLRTEEGV